MTDINRLMTEIHGITIKKRRNAALLMGKSGNLLAIAPLTEALADPHPGGSQRDRQALGRLGDSSAIPGLITALGDSDLYVRVAAISAMEKSETVTPLTR